jgi:hypothetical protein
MNTSMIDYTAMDAPDGAARKPYEIEYHGRKVQIPDLYWDRQHGEVNIPALLKSNQDLRRKVSTRAAAPEHYEIRVPQDLAKARKVADDDPLAAAAMAWAKKQGLPQEAFDELVETFVRQEAEQLDPAKFRDMQMGALKEQFGHRCDEVCKDVGHWFGALMQPDFEAQPELREAAEELASDARGVMLLKAIRDRLTERGVPGERQARADSMDEAALRRMQGSEAYINSRHPDHNATVRRVRDGWQKLVERS